MPIDPNDLCRWTIHLKSGSTITLEGVRGNPDASVDPKSPARLSILFRTYLQNQPLSGDATEFVFRDQASNVISTIRVNIRDITAISCLRL